LWRKGRGRKVTSGGVKMNEGWGGEGREEWENGGGREGEVWEVERGDGWGDK